MCLLDALWSALKPNGTTGTRQMGIPFGKPALFLRDMSNFEYGIVWEKGSLCWHRKLRSFDLQAFMNFFFTLLGFAPSLKMIFYYHFTCFQ